MSRTPASKASEHGCSDGVSDPATLGTGKPPIVAQDSGA